MPTKREILLLLKEAASCAKEAGAFLNEDTPDAAAMDKVASGTVYTVDVEKVKECLHVRHDS